MASEASQPLIEYGATQTTTFITVISITEGQTSATILYPEPAITASTSYTTRAAVTGPDRFSIPATSLPVLVLTDVVGFFISSGVVMETRTLHQQPPAPTIQVNITSTDGTVVKNTCSSGACWTLSQKIGTGFGVLLAGLAVVGAICWVIRLKRGKHVRARGNMMIELQDRDIESGTDHDGGRGQNSRSEEGVLFSMMYEGHQRMLGNQGFAAGPSAVRPPSRSTSPSSSTRGQHPRISELPDSVISSEGFSDNRGTIYVEELTDTSVTTSSSSESDSSLLDEHDMRTLPKIQVTAPTPERKRQQSQRRGRSVSDSPTQIRGDLLLPSSAENQRPPRRAAGRRPHQAAPRFSRPSRIVRPLVIQNDEGLVFALDEGEDMRNPRARRPESIIARVTTRASRRQLAARERRNREAREFELMEMRRNEEREQRRADRRGRDRSSSPNQRRPSNPPTAPKNNKNIFKWVPFAEKVVELFNPKSKEDSKMKVAAEDRRQAAGPAPRRRQATVPAPRRRRATRRDFRGSS